MELKYSVIFATHQEKLPKIHKHEPYTTLEIEMPVTHKTTKPFPHSFQQKLFCFKGRTNIKVTQKYSHNSNKCFFFCQL